MKLKILIATGTRADWGLLRPLADEFRHRGVEPLIAATNAHLDPLRGMTVNEIIADGYQPVQIPSNASSPVHITAKTMRGFDELFKSRRPDMVVILGDRFEMLGVATAALLNHIPVAHIAGGTVSEGAYDNTIRAAISQIASLHFPETELCAERLRKMGIPGERIFTAGALGVWQAAVKPLPAPQDKPKRPHLVVTLHAETAPGSPSLAETTRTLVDALAPRLTDLNLIVTYPNNDVDATEAISIWEELAKGNPETVTVVPSLGLKRYQEAVLNSAGVVGNSSSGIVEVASLGVPTLDIGNRQHGRERAATVIHADNTVDSISEGIDRLLSGEMQTAARERRNPYANPETPAIIAGTILSHPLL